MCPAVHNAQSAELALFHAVAEAQAAEFAEHRAFARHAGGGDAVAQAFIVALGDGVHAVAGDHGHHALHFHGLLAHDLRHGVGTGFAAGGALADAGLALQHSLGVGRAAGEAAAAAVGAGQRFDQGFQALVGLHGENLRCDGQHQAEYRAHAAEDENCIQYVLHRSALLNRRSSCRRSP